MPRAKYAMHIALEMPFVLCKECSEVYVIKKRKSGKNSFVLLRC